VRIESRRSWWLAVEERWEDLLDIMRRFLPTEGYEDRDGKILEKPLWMKLVSLKENLDPELARYFHAAWAAAPDDRSIHSLPSWGVLCDLCSEDYVLHDEEVA
jgi:hypothetical protein